MTPFDPVEFGRQIAQLEAVQTRLVRVEATMDSVNNKVDTILVTLAEKRGERKAAGYIAGLVGTLVSIAVAIAARLMEK